MAQDKQDKRLEREIQLGQQLQDNKKELKEIIASGKEDEKTLQRKIKLTQRDIRAIKEQQKVTNASAIAENEAVELGLEGSIK